MNPIAVDRKWLTTIAIAYKADAKDDFIAQVREYHYGHPVEIFQDTADPLKLLLLTNDGRTLRASPGSWFVVDSDRGAWIMSGPHFETFYEVREPGD